MTNISIVKLIVRLDEMLKDKSLSPEDRRFVYKVLKDLIATRDRSKHVLKAGVR